MTRIDRVLVPQPHRSPRDREGRLQYEHDHQAAAIYCLEHEITAEPQCSVDCRPEHAQTLQLPPRTCAARVKTDRDHATRRP